MAKYDSDRDNYGYSAKPGELQPVKPAFPNMPLDDDDVEAAAMDYGDDVQSASSVPSAEHMCKRISYDT